MTQILISIVIAIGISLLVYAKKVQKGEAFELMKLLRTALIGLILGGLAYYKGLEITADNWETLVTANAGAIAVADYAVVALYRLYQQIFKKKESP